MIQHKNHYSRTKTTFAYSEMTNLDKILKFRNEKEPLYTKWECGDHKLFGALVWRGAQPILQLHTEFEGTRHWDNLEKSDPFLNDTKAPKKFTFSGNTQKYGQISLCNCMQSKINTSNSFDLNRTYLQVEFILESVWIGEQLDEIDGNVDSAVARDTRLGGFFGVPCLERVLRYGNEASKKFELLGHPKEIWLWKGPNEWQIPMGDTGFCFGVNTSVCSSTSATSGYSLNSTVDLHIHSNKPTKIESFQKAIFQLEQILSLYSVERFSFLSQEFLDADGKSSTLAWRLGEDEELFAPPMAHQVLADFTDRAMIEVIFKNWFLENRTVELSRWLFTRSLEETQSGIARFVAVSQAFEVLGREFGPSPKISKSDSRSRLKKFRNLIDGEFDEEFIARIDKLVSSSSQNSYKDVISHMIGEAVEYYKLGKRDDVDAVCKKFSDLRNTIVHMSDKKQGELDEAFSIVNKMSLRLSFFYVLVQAHLAKLPLQPNCIESFLYNNRNVRHGLNNEILEHL